MNKNIKFSMYDVEIKRNWGSFVMKAKDFSRIKDYFICESDFLSL